MLMRYPRKLMEMFSILDKLRVVMSNTEENNACPELKLQEGVLSM